MEDKKIRVAINGFGRIGRAFFKVLSSDLKLKLLLSMI